MRIYQNKDYPLLKILYTLIFILSLLTNQFLTTSPHQDVLNLNILIYCLYSAWDLRRLGYISTRKVFTAMSLVVLLAHSIGPGALFAGTWFWRERVIYQLSTEPR